MTNETTAPERVWIESQAEETAEGYGSWDCRNVYDYDLEYVPATALEAAQARIAELEWALKLAEHDISYAFDRLGIPKEKSSVLPVIRAALEGKG